MAQLNWVFLDDFGGRHKVGLYHGDRTGHVMIHCNMRVVQVDFSVKDSKMYSFFIEDELCEVIMEKQHGAFSYEFRVNKKADTPRNRDRRKEDGKDKKQIAILAGSLLVVLGIAFVGLRWYGQAQEAKRMSATSIVSKYSKENMQRLAAEGKRTFARLHMTLTQNPSERKISYVLLSLDSLMEQGDFMVEGGDPIILPNGFPFTEGDEFEAIYLPGDPQVHRVDFFQPAHSTTMTYLRMANLAERKNNAAISPDRVVCRVLTTAEKMGWTSLAYFIFQDKTVDENERYNQQSYNRLMQDPDVLKVIQERCEHR